MNFKDVVNKTSSLRYSQYPAGKINKISYIFNRQARILYVKANMTGSTGNTYTLNIGFKNISISDSPDKVHKIKYSDKSGVLYLSVPKSTTDVHFRCQCMDFRHMWMWPDKKVKSLLGPAIPYTRVPGSNRPPKNPDDVPGLCKHLLELLRVLAKNKILELDQTTSGYLRRKVR